MKKNISILLALVMLFSILPNTGILAAANSQTQLFCDTFDELELGILTSLPMYYFDQNSGTREVVLDPDNNGNKVVKFTKEPGGAHKTLRWFGTQLSSVNTISGDFRFDSLDTDWGFEIRMTPYTNEDEMAVIKQENNEDYGYLYVGGVKTLQRIDRDTWYSFAFVIDQDTLTYQVIVNNSSVGSGNFPDSYNGKQFDAFNIKNYTNEGTSALFIDNIRACTGAPDSTDTTQPEPTPNTPSTSPEPYFTDTYDDISAEELTTLDMYYFDQNGGTRSITLDPANYQNQVLRLSKNYNPIGLKTIRWLGFHPTEEFTIQAKMRFSNISSNWGFDIRMTPYAEMSMAITNKNTSGNYANFQVAGINTSKAIYANTWYTVSFVINPSANTYGIYIDGEAISTNNALPTDFVGKEFDGISINNFTKQGVSSIYVDDLTAYPGPPSFTPSVSPTASPAITPTPSFEPSETTAPPVNPEDPWWERMLCSDAVLYHSDILNNNMAYRLFKPVGYSEASSQTYPLLISLGGTSYEYGYDNVKQLERTNFAEPLTATDYAYDFPCFILVPQCPEGSSWDTSYSENIQLQTVVEIAENITEEYEIDPDRVYLGGMSQGATGVWEMLAHRKDLFAAMVSISGLPIVNENTLATLSDVPIWNFWSVDDYSSNIPKQNRDAMQSLESLGGSPICTEYLYGGHVIWTDKVFKSPVFKWLFAQKKGEFSTNENLANEITEYNQNALDADANLVIANSSIDLDGERAYIRTQSTPFGNLVTDAMRYYTGADIAIQQGGGFVSSLGKGDISYGDVKKALPYDNNVVLVRISGENLLAALQNGFSAYPELDGRFPQVSGLEIEFDSSLPEAERIKNVFIHGQALELEKNYLLATNDYLTNGGDGYQSLAASETLYKLDLIRNLVVKYITEKGIDSQEISSSRIMCVNKPVPAIPQTGTLIPGHIEAEAFAQADNVSVVSTDDDAYIENLVRTNWMDYSISVSNTQEYTAKLKVSSAVDGARVQIRDAEGNLLGTTNIPNSNGTWTTLHVPITLSEGLQTLKITVGSGDFMFDSMEIIDRNDVAFGKTASADSYQAWTKADRAIDGDTSTLWRASDASANHWWQIDLGTLHDLTDITILWENGNDVDNYGPVYNYMIEVSENGEIWETVVDRGNNQNGRQEISDALVVNGVQFVRITVISQNYGYSAGFYEVNIWGNESAE